MGCLDAYGIGMDDRILTAAAVNHYNWFARNAEAAGGETRRLRGADYIYSPGEQPEVVIPFPDLSEIDAGIVLDRILTYCRDKPSLHQVSCWSLTESTQPPDLGIRLVARGFEAGWRPHWMSIDLSTVQLRTPPPPGLSVDEIRDTRSQIADDLPNYSEESARRSLAFAKRYPDMVRHFGGWVNGTLVAHAALSVAEDRREVGGIYDVGVAPEVQRRGYGTAVTLAALRCARSLGCRCAVLNATLQGEPMYERIGFESLGSGQTWWMHRECLEATPPSVEHVAFIEAIGRGDIVSCDVLLPKPDSKALNLLMPNGQTPVQFAAELGRVESVEWLVAHGAVLDVISAWTLGWTDRTRRLLTESPGLVNARLGKGRTTPLHEAVMRDDVELVSILLEAGADLEARDGDFDSTPLGWAEHLGRTEIGALITKVSS